MQPGTELDCDNIGNIFTCNLGSKVFVEVFAGTCYKIRLGGRFGSEPAGLLTIHLDACPTGLVTFDDPPNGVVDARQPHPPSDDSTFALQGIQSFLVSGPPGTDQLSCWDRAFCENAPEGTSFNAVTSVDDNQDGTFTVHLGEPIPTGGVITLWFFFGNDFCPDSVCTAGICVGGDRDLQPCDRVVGVFTSHPSNVNGDGVSDPDMNSPDLFDLIS
ncbi:MAG: hypothetical protein IIA65_06200, partial [Planctomycetes bacterium]|nr:hypothetical protein [Planctomycetota bacterium]